MRVATILAAALIGQQCLPQQYVTPQVVQPPVVQAQVVQTQVVAVPVTTLALPYYYSVGDQLREDRLADAVAKRLAGKLPQPPEPKAGGKTVAPRTIVAESPQIDGQVQEIFAASCATCHAPGQAKAGLVIFAADGSLYVDPDPAAELVRRWRILDSVTGGPDVNFMPKNGEPLTVDEVDTVRKWMRSYASSIKK